MLYMLDIYCDYCDILWVSFLVTSLSASIHIHLFNPPWEYFLTAVTQSLFAPRENQTAA